AGDLAFEPAEMIDVGDNTLADLAGCRGQYRHTTGRHVDDAARIFLPVLQHQPSQKVYFDALMAAALLTQGQDFHSGRLRDRHSGRLICRAATLETHP